MIPQVIPFNASASVLPIEFVGFTGQLDGALTFSNVAFLKGDLFVRLNRHTSTSTQATPAGWNLFWLYSNTGAGARHQAFWKIAQSNTETDPADIGTLNGRNALYVWRNAYPEVSTLVEAPINAATTSYTIPAITTALPGAWCVCHAYSKALQPAAWDATAKPTAATARNSGGGASATSPGFAADYFGTGWSATVSVCNSTNLGHACSYVIRPILPIERPA